MWIQPSPSSKTSWNCRSSALETFIFSSKVSILSKYFTQAHKGGIGSPSSTIVVNLFMENFEIKTFNTVTNPKRVWLRYVDDIVIIKKAEHSHQCLQHINIIDLHIQVTVEAPNTDGSRPFWTLQFHLDLTIHYSLQSTGNLPTETSTFTVIVTTNYLLSILLLTPLCAGQGLFVPTQSYWKRKTNT